MLTSGGWGWGLQKLAFHADHRDPREPDLECVDVSLKLLIVRVKIFSHTCSPGEHSY